MLRNLTRSSVRLEKSLIHANKIVRYKCTYPSQPINTELLSSKSTQTEIANALRPHFEAQSPVLLKSPNVNSDALHSWESLEYLRKTVGDDEPCLVEIGGSYSNSNVERPEIMFGDYIQYMTMFQELYGDGAVADDDPKANELVYLAQNDLFSPLHKDFQLPELCSNASFNVGNGSLYSTMLWFGPRGCISPLHFDPLDNLLMQFVGRKRVILFPRTDGVVSGEDEKSLSTWHYAGHDGQQYNTSPVDIANPDIEKYPLFAEAPDGIECLLEPGDILYIPEKWWHHVTSLETAKSVQYCVSVNAWWR